MVRIHAKHGEAVTRRSSAMTALAFLQLTKLPPKYPEFPISKPWSTAWFSSSNLVWNSSMATHKLLPLSYRVLRNHVQALERELNSDSEFQKLLAGIEFGWEDSSRLCWALEAMRELSCRYAYRSMLLMFCGRDIAW